MAGNRLSFWNRFSSPLKGKGYQHLPPSKTEHEEPQSIPARVEIVAEPENAAIHITLKKDAPDWAQGNITTMELGCLERIIPNSNSSFTLKTDKNINFLEALDQVIQHLNRNHLPTDYQVSLPVSSGKSFGVR